MSRNRPTGDQPRRRVMKAVLDIEPKPADPTRVTVNQAARAVSTDWVLLSGDPTPSAALEGWLDLVSRFAAYCTATGIRRLARVDEAVCVGWIEAPLSNKSNRATRTHGGNAAGRPPSDSTRMNRRACLRGFFRTARALGLYEGDPTLDIDLPPRMPRSPRALTETEVQRVRDTCRYSPDLTLLPAAVALTLASATTGEMACLTMGDVYLDDRRVWLHAEQGGHHHRWGALDQWGADAIANRMGALRQTKGRDPNILLVYTGSPTKPVAARTAATAMHLRRALTLAGITRPDAIPLSFLDYLAARILAETGSIETVAARLGLRGLDRAAELTGYDWRAGYSVSPPTAITNVWNVPNTPDISGPDTSGDDALEPNAQDRTDGVA